MRASPFWHLRWVATPVRLPRNQPWARAHPLCHALNTSVSSTPQHRFYAATVPSRLLHGVDSTIYALSTAPGRAAIAVVRVSGPACVSVGELHFPSEE
ncbi:hypothetical protein BDW60DRAFT_107879 [Aspergillus nidulans var. acristatus]